MKDRIERVRKLLRKRNLDYTSDRHELSQQLHELSLKRSRLDSVIELDQQWIKLCQAGSQNGASVEPVQALLREHGKVLQSRVRHHQEQVAQQGQVVDVCRSRSHRAKKRVEATEEKLHQAVGELRMFEENARLVDVEEIHNRYRPLGRSDGH